MIAHLLFPESAAQLALTLALGILYAWAWAGTPQRRNRQ